MRIINVYIQHGLASLDRPFTYVYGGKKDIKPGCRVIVSFHNQKVMGFVHECMDSELSRDEISEMYGYNIAEIDSVVDEEPLLNDELTALSREVSQYYLSPLAATLQTMLPSSLKPSMSSLRGPKIAYETYVELIDGDEEGLTDKQKEMIRLIAVNSPILKKEAGSDAVLKALINKGKVRLFKKERNRFVLPEYEKEQRPKELTFAQLKAVEDIQKSEKSVVLLQGVTGSGKTEVYLKLSEIVLEQGKNVLMLVPEISLTPVMVEYFSRRFGNSIAILHSELTPGEKYDEYRRIANKKARIVVGARSAVFAPLDNIGLIILDEEHVDSYKQENVPCYHAREVAIMRAKHFDAKVVLGSATPSLESKIRAYKGAYGYASLPDRINASALPKTRILDLRDRSIMMPKDIVFSRILLNAIKERLEKKEQVILLINRRGYSSYVSCVTCGHIFKCPNCSANLTYHRFDELLKCHHCGFVEPYPEVCPECGSTKIVRVGFGTERIVKVLQEYLPEAKIARLDSDVAKVRKKMSEVLRDFRDLKYDILVGTQMIAKGHDFPNVTLVGVALADIGLSSPSYRASESTFQLITQAVGRSGRAKKEGVALIQTYNPFHYAISLGAKQDYESFFLKEMQQRKITSFPPYVSLIALRFSCKDEDRCVQAAVECAMQINAKFGEAVTCVGPVVPQLAIVGGFHKRSLLIKAKHIKDIKDYVWELVKALSGKGGVGIETDVDPLDY